MVYYSIKREAYGTTAYLLSRPEPHFTALYSALTPDTAYYTYAQAKNALTALKGTREAPECARYTTVKVYSPYKGDDLKCKTKAALCAPFRP